MTDLTPVNAYANHSFSNLMYDPQSEQFYTRCKKKITIEVDDFKPIKWTTVVSQYTLRNGEISQHEYKYINVIADDHSTVRINKNKVNEMITTSPTTTINPPV
jgi:hypothetical protein